MNTELSETISKYADACRSMHEAGDRVQAILDDLHEKERKLASAKLSSLTDAEIDRLADEVMPDGLDGFLKHWGWRQFARAIEREHGIGGDAKKEAPPPLVGYVSDDGLFSKNPVNFAGGPPREWTQVHGENGQGRIGGSGGVQLTSVKILISEPTKLSAPGVMEL